MSAGKAAASSAAVTVTVAAAASSDTDDGLADSVTSVEAVSSSVIVTSAPATVRPEALPPSESASSPSANPSSTGVSVNVPVPLVAPAAMVTSKSATAW